MLDSSTILRIKHMRNDLKMKYKDIAQVLGIDPRTVSSCVKKDFSAQPQKVVRKKPRFNKYHESFVNTVKELRAKDPHVQITGSLIQELVVPKDENGEYVYGLRSVHRLLSKVFIELGIKEQKQLSNRELFAAKAGMAHISMAQLKVTVENQYFPTTVYVMTFDYSQRIVACVTSSWQIEGLLDALSHMFFELNYIPEQIRFNNLKEFVEPFQYCTAKKVLIKDVNGNEVLVQEAFAHTMDYYDFQVKFASPNKAKKDKSLIRVLNYLAETIATKNLTVEDFFANDFCEEINNDLSTWTKSLLTSTVSADDNRIVGKLFNAEKKKLHRAPDRPCDPIVWLYKDTVDKWGRVNFQGFDYPSGCKLGEKVDIGVTGRDIYFRHKGKITAQHQRFFFLFQRL